jgi:tetratricopeptide (TPR) repeat protein
VSGQGHNEVLDRIRRQLDELNKSVESRLKAGPGAAQNAGDVVPADSKYVLKAHEPRVGREMLIPETPGSVSGQVSSGRQNRLEPATAASLNAAQNIRSLPESVAGLSRSELSSEARRVMGRHNSPDSFAADKFSRHLRAAEDYLRAGEYYKAADSFALASVYRPDDPRALAGRSHALFAAGEYISSALFLSRALAIKPEHVTVRVDFVTLLGGPSRLAGRIADIEQWFARSGSGRLQLLLSYVYYQTGRLNEAGRAIEAARAKMPKSAAVAAITAAINDAAAGQ